MNAIVSWRETEELMRSWDLALSETVVASSPEEARRATGILSGPYALKAIAPHATHKSDHDLVALDLSSADEVFRRATAMSVSTQRVEAFLLQRMVRGGVEMITGIVRDAVFGPLVVFGAGGIWVEILSDTRFLYPGFTRDEARYVLEAMPVYRILNGDRRRGTFAINRFLDHLLHLGAIAAALPAHVDALDLNPVIVGTQTVHLVDIRIAGGAYGA